MTTDRDVQTLADILQKSGVRLAVAESLTGGQICARLTAGDGASDWFAGGVVAYTLDAKRRLLGYTGDEPVSHDCASTMADGVRRLFDADIGLGVTGVGGPGPEDGTPAGTVWLSVTTPDVTESRLRRLPGPPQRVLDRACAEAVAMALTLLSPPGDRDRLDTTRRGSAAGRDSVSMLGT